MPSGSEFTLASWYSSDLVKRNFGRVCQAVNEEGATITLLGSAERPWLILADIDEHPEQPGDIELTIDEAKADWSAITTAAAIYGTRFRIKGKKRMRAVLFKHPKTCHPAEQYLRSSSVDVDRLADRIEVLAKEVRRLGRKFACLAIPSAAELGEVAERLTGSADVIDRRFRELWRFGDAQGHA